VGKAGTLSCKIQNIRMDENDVGVECEEMEWDEANLRDVQDDDHSNTI
jgi:hypothetical protein